MQPDEHEGCRGHTVVDREELRVDSSLPLVKSQRESWESILDAEGTEGVPDALGFNRSSL